MLQEPFSLPPCELSGPLHSPTSKFRFTVENGLSCDVILKGRGSYEEDHD